MLGLNIDHIATLREARKVNDPNIAEALFLARDAGAHMITIHLREDERHINKNDLSNIIKLSPLPVNIESSINKEILNFITPFKPFKITLVPENRAEITTEGGLNLELDSTKEAISVLLESSTQLSLFIEPSLHVIRQTHALGVKEIELHTGRYSNIYAMLHSNLAHSPNSIAELELSKEALKNALSEEIKRIKEACELAYSMGIRVCAGHGLNRANLPALADIKEIEEFNIGHSIISRAIFIGLERAIKEILDIIKR